MKIIISESQYKKILLEEKEDLLIKKSPLSSIYNFVRKNSDTTNFNNNFFVEMNTRTSTR